MIRNEQLLPSNLLRIRLIALINLLGGRIRHLGTTSEDPEGMTSCQVHQFYGLFFPDVGCFTQACLIESNVYIGPDVKYWSPQRPI
jgi:hypothetical protein